jgi:repressor LexA
VGVGLFAQASRTAIGGERRINAVRDGESVAGSGGDNGGHPRYTEEPSPGGWRMCWVRATARGKLLAAAEVPNVGVGEVFVVAGQSKPNNRGEESMASDNDESKFKRAISESLPLLREAARQLAGVLGDELMMAEVPLELESQIDSASRAIAAALDLLEAQVRTVQRTTKASSATQAKRTPATTGKAGSGKPTRPQGQFLAFIHEFMQHNYAGVAPTHAELQRFFNLTPPSVNSMLIRLEQLGFIRRIPGKARAIELTIRPDMIPPLERPFKF